MLILDFGSWGQWGPGGVEVFPLRSSAGITAVGLLAMPNIAKVPI
jgi:hypothetical protein